MHYDVGLCPDGTPYIDADATTDDWREYLRGGVVMQSSGITDVNRKQIFEGDVYRLRREGNTRHWSNYTVHSLADFLGHKGWDEAEDCAYYTPDNLEVIGNIYENPDLLPISA